MVDLPFAHNPFKCAHAERFVAPAADASDDAAWMQAGAEFFEQLGPADFASCLYHQGDWRRIAAAAVEVVDASPPGGPYDAALAVVGRTRTLFEPRSWLSQRLSRQEVLWLRFLFHDPIAYRPGAARVVNGQHRVCALRAAGASECPVASDP